MADSDGSEPRSLQDQFESDPWPVVGFTTAEHNNLTSRRGTLTSETTGRVGAYLSTLSAALVALGFVAGGDQTGFGDQFYAFGAVALLLTSVVGLVTFIRCLQGSVEDVVLGQRIERIRRAYLELVPGLTDHIEPPLDAGLDEARRASGMTGPSGWQLVLTQAGLVSIVNSAVIGVVAGFLLQLADADPVVSWIVGAVLAMLSTAAHLSSQHRSFTAAERANRRASPDG